MGKTQIVEKEVETEVDEETDEEQPTDEDIEATKNKPKPTNNTALIGLTCDRDSLAEVFGNGALLSFVRKNSVEPSQIKLGEEVKKTGTNLGIEVRANSIGIMNTANTTMLLTNASVEQKRIHNCISLTMLKDAMSLMTKEQIENADLVMQSEKNMPCFVRSEHNVLVIAPRV